MHTIDCLTSNLVKHNINKIVHSIEIMKKIICFFYMLLGKKISDEQQEDERRNAEVKYRLYSGDDNLSISLFLKEKAIKLWWRPRWKKIKEGCFLVALYTNPFERAFSPKAVLLDKESRYNKFVKSKNRKKTWYLIPRWMAYDHSYYHCL